MHPALQIHEILLNIFGHCLPPRRDLAALARTCRAFRDPALDVLWEVFRNISPLVRCLPDACYLPPTNNCYSFRRSLTRDEWDVLQSYTRRIRSIYGLSGLDRESAQRLWRTPEPLSLFPSLRHLEIEYTRKAVQLLLIPFPSLTSMDITVHTLRLIEDSLKSLSKNSPCLRELRIHPHRVNIDHIDPTFICQWQHLQIVLCPQIILDIVTLAHLSRISALTQLEFKVDDTFPDVFETPLVFSRLVRLTLHSESLNSISRLLHRVQLLVVDFFSALIERRPPSKDLFSFLASAQTTDLYRTTRHLSLHQNYVQYRVYTYRDRPLLGFRCLKAFTAFPNLHCLDLNLECNIHLKDSELLTVVSTWPHLRELRINMDWGWNTPFGITPNGLVQLLQTCPSLTTLALAIEARGFTTVPPSVKLTSSSLEYIYVLDSFLEEDSVPAITAFFADVKHTVTTSGSQAMPNSPNWSAHNRHWWNVRFN